MPLVLAPLRAQVVAGGGSFPFKHDEFVVYERSQLYPRTRYQDRRKPLPQ